MQTREGATQTGADDGIDDDVGRRDLGGVQFPALGVGYFDNRHAQPPDQVEIDSRIPAHVGRGADHHDRDIDAPLLQRARDDEPVAAVVANAAQGDDPLAGQVLDQ